MAKPLGMLTWKDCLSNIDFMRGHDGKFLIRNDFGQAQGLLGEEVVVPGYEELQFILHVWLYDKRGGWAITERSSGKRITVALLAPRTARALNSNDSRTCTQGSVDAGVRKGKLFG
jgi:hypothetical protein